MSYRYYGAAPETPEQVQAKAALQARLLAAVQQMHDTVARAKDKVYGTSSTETLVKVALLSAPFVGPLVGVAAAAITAWIYNDHPSTEEVKQNIVNGLNTIDAGVVGRLHGEIPSVLSGQITPEKWMAAYAEVIKGIAAQLDELGQTTLASSVRQEKDAIYRNISSAADAFKTAVANAVAKVADVAKTAVTPLFLGVGVILGIYLISWLPRRR